jgi:hypothetical protein
MCYNAEVSAATFLFTTAVCIFLWYRNLRYDHPMAIILFVVGLMQALEWGLWRNLACGSINKLLTAAIPLLLFLQPLVINAAVHYYKAGWGIGYDKVAYGVLGLLLYKLYQVYTHFGECAIVKNKHLQWTISNATNYVPFSYLENKLYGLAMIYPLVTFKHRLFGLLYFLAGLVSMYILGANFPETWPSVWCHFVNFLSVFAIVAPQPA